MSIITYNGAMIFISESGVYSIETWSGKREFKNFSEVKKYFGEM